MRVLIVIPARHASSRFPGKPLAMLRGAGGEARSLLHRSWEAGGAAAADLRAAGHAARVLVATDDGRIVDHAASFGAEAIMTPDTCRNGTERCAAVLDLLDEAPDLVINLQGDAPLTPPWFLTALARAMGGAGAAVATPVLLASPAHAAALRADRAAGRVGGTTAVADRAGRALYFSKEVLPFGGGAEGEPELLHHVGAYAYHPEALRTYAGWPEGPLERAEGLEQLRFLENGAAVLCVPVEDRGRPFWELNNPEDVSRIEAMMAAIGMG